jgi:glycosyltransferase involved in cell wall biosynthesis
MNAPVAAPRVCFLGSAKYAHPLPRTQQTKWAAMASLGEMHVVAFSATWHTLRFDQERVHFYLLPRVPLQIARYALLMTAGTLVAAWVIVTRRVDVIVAQGPYEGGAAVVARALGGMFGRRAALVVESHGDFERNLFMQGGFTAAGLYRRAMKPAARFSLCRADALRAISVATAQQLRDWGCTQPLVSFPTWTEIDVFLQTTVGAAPSPTSVVYAGVLTPGKGVHFLLSAFAALTGEFGDARLRLVGAEPMPDYAADLRRLAAEPPLSGRVTFVGAAPQDVLAAHIAQSAVLVLPTLSEGLGRVIIEAMAVGRPVIASNVGGVPDLVIDGETGLLVPPADPQSLVDALRWMFTHPREAAAMGAAGRTRASRIFSTDQYLRGYSELFALATGKGHGPTATADAQPGHRP